ncbi:MAG: prohibitin family protein [Pseudomonas sp.]|uniref:prohibitin family protein n=1 Tax=Pseudomonas sp. TaxID=306 RepID=UPI003397A209
MSSTTRESVPMPTPHAHAGIRQAVHTWCVRNAIQLYALVLMLLLGLIALAPYIFISVPAGHVGVHWKRFQGGTVTDYHFDEGVNLILPWDSVILYDARLQNNARIYDTISSDGLSMQVEIAVRYRINRDSVGDLHRLVGPDYPEVMVYPEIGSHARSLISTYTPEQLYTSARAFIQAQILQRMVHELASPVALQSTHGRLIEVEDVLIRSVTLPESIAGAIERKVEQYHVMLEYDFRIEREKRERERKKIEAEGVREFQDIVSHTITEEYLRLRGVEATLALATSNNSKMIIIGGRDGLPVILNTGDTGALQPDKVEANEPLPITPPNATPAAGDLRQSPGPATATADDPGHPLATPIAGRRTGPPELPVPAAPTVPQDHRATQVERRSAED